MVFYLGQTTEGKHDFQYAFAEGELEGFKILG